MNTRMVLILGLATTIGGCGKNDASEKQVQVANDAKVRAEAARKEMDALPQAFHPRYNKRLEPESPAVTKAAAETKR